MIFFKTGGDNWLCRWWLRYQVPSELSRHRNRVYIGSHDLGYSPPGVDVDVSYLLPDAIASALYNCGWS